MRGAAAAVASANLPLGKQEPNGDRVRRQLPSRAAKHGVRSPRRALFRIFPGEFKAVTEERQTLPTEAPRSSIHLLLIGTAIVIGCLLLWQLSNLLLLIFGAVLFAVLLRALSGLIEEKTPLGDKGALAVAGLVVLLLVGGFAFLLGNQVQAQIADLAGRLPGLIDRIGDRLGVENAQSWVMNKVRDVIADSSIVADLAGYSSSLAGILGNTLLVLTAGVYLAISPALYRNGVLKLFPAKPREQASETVSAVGGALKLWLVGQLAAMVLVGFLTGLGLWLLGIPSALTLGLAAGLLEFVPFIGPILSAAPAIAIGLAEGPSTAMWVAGLYIAIQQVEGNLITPLIQKRAVDLPPALTIFAIVAFGILFGTLGVLFATPLCVVLFVVVKKVWLRDTLHEDTDVPGQEDAEQAT